MMELYLYWIGVLIAAGFFLGIYVFNKDFTDGFGGNDTGAIIVMAIILTMIVGILSWLSIIAMIVRVQSSYDTQNWNVKP